MINGITEIEETIGAIIQELILRKMELVIPSIILDQSFDFFMYKYPHFRLFVESPTAKMLQTVDKMFPVIERAEVVDPFPLLEDLNSRAFLEGMETETSKKAGMITFLVSLVVVLLSIRLLVRLSTRFGR